MEHVFKFFRIVLRSREKDFEKKNELPHFFTFPVDFAHTHGIRLLSDPLASLL